jgi:hypothetical protein
LFGCPHSGLELPRQVGDSRHLGEKTYRVTRGYATLILMTLTAILNVSAATERGGNSTVALPFCACTALNGWLWMFLGYS